MRNTIILIVDDHPMMRKALKLALEDQGGLMIVHEADTVREGIRKAEELQPDLILLDLYLPDGNGVELVRKQQELFPRSRILVVTSSKKESDVIQTIEAGVTSYIVKDAPPEQFMLAVRSVLSGNAFVTPAVTNIVLKHMRDAGTQPPDAIEGVPLSERELEIMRLLAHGANNTEIGQKLQISESTVRTHSQRIQKKLGVRSHNHLIVHAVQNYY